MRQPPSAFTLTEMLIVVALVSVLAAAAITATQSSVSDELQSAARLLTSDMAYARSMAVANNSTYRLTFNLAQNRYTLTHSGTNSSLNTLPATPFRSPDNTATQQVVDFDDLPQLAGQAPVVAAMGSLGASPAPTTTVDFGPLGETTRSVETAVWFAAGSGANRRYLALRVDPTTGLVTIDPLTATGPPASIVAN